MGLRVDDGHESQAAYPDISPRIRKRSCQSADEVLGVETIRCGSAIVPPDTSFLFLNIVRLKFAIAAELNDHHIVHGRNKMRYAGRNENETARRVRFQFCGVEFCSLAQIPGSCDDGNRFVLRVRMREDTFAGGYLGPIDPCAGPS